MSRTLNQDRQDAIDLGLTTYIGSTHTRCGTNVRYISGACVHCARVVATEQREALKYLKAQRAASASSADGIDPEMQAEDDAEKLNQHLAGELDSVDVDAVDEDDGDARFQESLDEMM